MLTKLKPDIKEAIKNDPVLQAKIITLFNKRNPTTAQRWLKADNPVLTIPAVLRTIREHKGLAEDVELMQDDVADVRKRAA